MGFFSLDSSIPPGQWLAIAGKLHTLEWASHTGSYHFIKSLLFGGYAALDIPKSNWLLSYSRSLLAYLIVSVTWLLAHFWLLAEQCKTWRRQWQPTPVLLPGKPHGWKSLVGCSPCGLEESDTTERLHFHFSLSCIGEANGNPLQCSCLENPRDGGAWWAAVYGVAQSQTQLMWLSSSSSNRVKPDLFWSWSDIFMAPVRYL